MNREDERKLYEAYAVIDKILNDEKSAKKDNKVPKKIKKYKKKIKNQAKIINGLFDFLEKQGFSKNRLYYTEKNGKRKYSYLGLKENEFLKTLFGLITKN